MFLEAAGGRGSWGQRGEAGARALGVPRPIGSNPFCTRAQRAAQGRPWGVRVGAEKARGPFLPRTPPPLEPPSCSRKDTGEPAAPGAASP